MTNAIRKRTTVLGRFSTAMMKHHNKKKLGKERVYFPCDSILLFIVEGSQSRNSNRTWTWRQELMQRHGGVLITGLLPMTCSAFLSIEPRTTSPGVSPSTMGWLPISNEETSLYTCLSTTQSNGNLFLIVVHSLLMTLALGQVDIKASQHNHLLNQCILCIYYTDRLSWSNSIPTAQVYV